MYVLGWSHDMVTFSVLLVIGEKNPPQQPADNEPVL